MSAPEPLPPTLSRRFRMERELGRGGFGRVVLAQDLELKRPVAIKVMTARLTDPRARERFAREAALTARLDHPGIVKLYSFSVGEAGEPPSIVYEPIEGEGLEARLASSRRFTRDSALRLARQLASALDHAHAAGVIHRDVKPANVLLRQGSDDAVLVDFGIARGEDTPGKPGLTQGLILGTPGFMAEECWTGRPATPATDQFAFAALLHEVFFGEPVARSAQLQLVRRELAQGPRPRPTPATEGILPGVEYALRRGLDREPARRFPTLAALVAALEAGHDPGGDSTTDLEAPEPDSAPTVSRPDARLRPTLPGDRADSSWAGSPLVEGSGPPARALFLALAGLALAGLGALLLRPAPPPPPPVPALPASPKPALSPGLQALRLQRERIEAAFGPLAAPFRAGRRPLDLMIDPPGWDELGAWATALADPAFTRAWNAYLGEVESWIASLSRRGLAEIEAESPAEAARTVACLDLPVLQFAGFVAFAFHYPKNLALQSLTNPLADSSLASFGPEGAALAGRLAPQVDAFMLRIRGLSDRLALMAGPGEAIPMGARIVLECAAYGSPDRELLARLCARLPDQPTGLARYFLVRALAAPLLVGVSISNLRVEDRTATMGAIARSLGDLAKDPDPGRRKDLLDVLLLAGEKTLFQCAADTGSPELASFDAVLDLVEAQEAALRARLRPVAAACARIAERPANRLRSNPAIASRLARLYQATGLMAGP